MIFEIEVLPETLLKSGYRKQTNGFVRKKGDGRFHARLPFWKKKRKHVLDIHFDIYIDKTKLHPSTFYMPETLREEVKRIKSSK